MTVRIELAKPAFKALADLPRHVQHRFAKAIETLAETWPLPQRLDAKRLEGEHVLWRLRVGEYRAIFEPRGDTLVITRIGHRSSVYR